MRGKFITIEGIECSGKSCQINNITAYLKGLGIDVKYMREPGGVKLGENLRNVILCDDYKDMSLIAETMLFLTIRAENIDKIIRPTLNSGTWVVCDRFMDSTYVYQGYLKGMPLHQIDDLHSLILDGYYPNKTFILDLPVEDAMKRLSGRNEVNRFDRMPIDMHNKIRSAYLDLSKRGENRYTVIDASLNSIAVFEQIQPYIDEML